MELDPKSGKVDHPPGGSKDLADSMTGVIYWLTMMTDVWRQFDVPLSELPDSLVEQVAREGEEADAWDEDEWKHSPGLLTLSAAGPGR